MERRDAQKYLSDTVLEDGTRKIVKLDGSVITIPTSGKVTVESTKPKQQKLGAIADGDTKKVRIAPRRPPDFSHLPLNERPLNVGSSDAELIAREMSNFEHAPFVLDGKEFASVEGLYVWLKWDGDAEKQKLAPELYSYEAKSFGSPSTNTSSTYNGVTFTLGSPEHHALVKRALQAKLQQHPDLARRFAGTHPREIIHDLGRPERPGRYMAKDFCLALTELRQALVDSSIETIAGPVSALEEAAAAALASTSTTSVAEFLTQLRTDPALSGFPLATFAEAFRETETRVTGLVAVGKNTIVLGMPDNLVLKISTRLLTPEISLRQFHLHLVERGEVHRGDTKVQYYTQPRVTEHPTAEQLKRFAYEVNRQGDVLLTDDVIKFGFHNGGLKLLNPFASTSLNRPKKA